MEDIFAEEDAYLRLLGEAIHLARQVNAAELAAICDLLRLFVQARQRQEKEQTP